jgi:hypothetical protein
MRGRGFLQVEHIGLALFEQPAARLRGLFDALALDATRMAGRIGKLLGGEDLYFSPP